MSLTPMQTQLLAALEAMPPKELSPSNRTMLARLQQTVLDEQRAGLPGSVSFMIEVGGGKDAPVAILPSDRAADKQSPTPGQPCANCNKVIQPRSIVGKRIYACPCGRKWDGPTATRIASISSSDPRNQPRTPTTYPSSSKPTLLASSQKWRGKSKDKSND